MYGSSEISYNCIALHLISVDDDDNDDDIPLVIYTQHILHFSAQTLYLSLCTICIVSSSELIGCYKNEMKTFWSFLNIFYMIRSQLCGSNV